LGASGRILIEPFLADGTYSSEYVMGVTAEAIVDGADGMVVHFGQIRQLNTSAFSDGDILYASSTTAGAFTTTSPTAPNNIVLVAIVIHAAANGIIQVRPTIGANINNDEGVKITSVANNDILKYNSSNQLWENSNVLSTKQDTITGAASTITTSNLTASRALISDGSGKVATNAVTSTELGYLSGVTSAIQTQLNTKISTSNQIFTFQIANTIAASATTFVNVNVTTTALENAGTIIIPVACTLSNMYTLHYTNTQPATGAQIITVRKNGVDTALSITIAAGSAPSTTPYSDLTNSVSFAVGDRLSFRRQNFATTAGGALNGLSLIMTL
jgi:hypothetical protein